VTSLVMKFGGTSVGSTAAIRRVVGIVSAVTGSSRVTVVVSAMAGVTDALLTACEAARAGDGATVARLLVELRDRHLEAVGELLANYPREAQELEREIQEELQALASVLDSIRVLRELTPRAQDRVAASGELMSSRIVAAAMPAHRVPTAWVDARTVIVTDDQHGCAAPLRVPTTDAVLRIIRPAAARGQVAVAGGFVGATEAGITTTLGRGGSDYSAALIGAALGADEIQIWTDVDGMLTADPRVVPEAQLVPRLSFGEASELAYFGAKVLHPSTILPAVERAIPVRIMNTMNPAGGGSLITGSSPADGRPLTAIACKRNVTVVDVTSTRMLMAHGFLRQLFEVFERHRTSVDVVTTSEISVSMTLDDDTRLGEIERDLAAFASVQVEPRMAIVSAVGDQLRADPTLGIKVVAALDGLPLRMVSQAASRRNVTVVLKDEQVSAAMARLHAAFLQPAGVR
jgi:aspartate kinase